MTATISDIMNMDLHTLTSDNSLWDAVQLMNQRNIRHLPIVEGEQLIGLVTQRDVLLHMHQTEQEQKSLKLSQIMKTGLRSIPENASIRSAALTIQKHKIGCLPVVEDRKLIGIVTDSDFVAVAINLLELMETNEPTDDGL